MNTQADISYFILYMELRKKIIKVEGDYLRKGREWRRGVREVNIIRNGGGGK